MPLFKLRFYRRVTRVASVAQQCEVLVSAKSADAAYEASARLCADGAKAFVGTTWSDIEPITDWADTVSREPEADIVLPAKIFEASELED